MGIEFARPLFWLLLPVCVALVLLLDAKGAKGRRRSVKRAIAKWTRLVLCLLLVAALTGPLLLLPGSQAATWVLADLSASVSSHQADMETAIQAGLAKAPGNLQVGALSFGQNTMVDAPLAQGRARIDLGTAPDGSGTDIGRALSMALALLPEDAAGRIALLSDGKDNGGGVSAQLAALKARGIAVDVLAIQSGISQDAQITALTPPSQVYQGEKFDVSVRLDSLYETTGTLVLYANREPIATREVTLRKGENTFVFQDTALESGVVTYEVQLVAQGDDNPSNNRLGAYMDVRGTPRVLVVGDGAEIVPMLRAAGMETETLLATQLPQTPEELRQYHAVLLDNVNDDDLTEAATSALSDYVRKLGRGLVTLGGDDSYALGGWRGSALEEILPVTMDVDNRLDVPSLGLVLVIDKSGSMTEGRYGITRLDMAKEAAMRASEVLTARDAVGVIAFDDTAKWVVPMQQVTDLAAIQNDIGSIRPGGGTMFFSAIAQALEALLETNTQLKHVIFLTDGESGDTGYESLIEMMVQGGITFTTVAVGSGANARLLSKLAELGNGRFYAADEFDDIPKVFTKETYLATQAYVQNRTFFPVIWSDGPLTSYAGFPALDGYLSTTAKPLSTVVLATDREDPLLAWWQYGAGRVISWTSDTQGAWSAGFLRWEDAPAFFAGIVSHVLPTEEGEGELTLTRDGNQVKLRYEVDDDEAGLRTEAGILSPDGTEQSVSLAATAPGVYEGEALIGGEGAYAVRVEQRNESALLRTLESGVAVGYSAEYDLRVPDGTPLLTQIAQETGGRVLEDPSELFTEQGARARAQRDITTLLLTIALILFVLDVAQRRLAWEHLLPAGRAAKEAKKPDSAKGQPGEPEKVPEKTSPSRKKKKAPKTPEPPAPDTGEKLLAGRKKKLM